MVAAIETSRREAPRAKGEDPAELNRNFRLSREREAGTRRAARRRRTDRAAATERARRYKADAGPRPPRRAFYAMDDIGDGAPMDETPSNTSLLSFDLGSGLTPKMSWRRAGAGGR